MFTCSHSLNLYPGDIFEWKFSILECDAAVAWTAVDLIGPYSVAQTFTNQQQQQPQQQQPPPQPPPPQQHNYNFMHYMF